MATVAYDPCKEQVDRADPLKAFGAELGPMKRKFAIRLLRVVRSHCGVRSL